MVETWQNCRTVFRPSLHQQQIAVDPGFRTDFVTTATSFGDLLGLRLRGGDRTRRVRATVLSEELHHHVARHVGEAEVST